MITPHNAGPTLYAELIRRGLPAEYARRTAEELDDHRVDLLADVLDERTADERIGETRLLAKRIAADYRQRSWFGRWPLLSFVLAPVPMLVLSWIGVCVGFGLLTEAWDLISQRPDGPLSTTEITVCQALDVAGLTLLFYVLPALLAWRYGGLALRTTQNRAYLLSVCLMLGLVSGFVWWKTELYPEGGETHGQVSMGIALVESPKDFLAQYGSPKPLSQLLTPLLVGGVVLWGDYRRRSGATPPPRDGRGRLPLAA